MQACAQSPHLSVSLMVKQDNLWKKLISAACGHSSGVCDSVDGAAVCA